MFAAIIDMIAARVAIWALRRLYGADCKTDVLDDFPGDTTIRCLSCDAGRIVRDLLEWGGSMKP